MRLNEILLAEGIVDEHALAALLAYREAHGGGLDTALLELGILDEPRLTALLERAENVKNRIDPRSAPDAAALARLHRNHAQKYGAVPFALNGRTLEVLLRQPNDLAVVDELGFITGLRIVPQIAPEARIAAHLAAAYGIPLAARLEAALREGARRDAVKEWEQRVTALRAAQADAAPRAPTPAPTLAVLPPAEPQRRYDELAAQIDHALDPLEVSGFAVGYLASVLGRVVLFSVRRGRMTGWDARGGRLRREAVENLAFSLDEPSIFSSACVTGAYSGPLPRGPIEEDFVIKLGNGWPEQVLVSAIRVQGKPVALLYGEVGDGDADARHRAHEPFGVVAGLLADACRRLILSRKGTES